MILPDSLVELRTKSLDLIEECRVGSTARASMARSFRQWKYTGSPDGNTAIYNKLIGHLQRLSSMIFSPGNLRFFIEFEMNYPAVILKQAETASRLLTKEYTRRNMDRTFSLGIDAALDFGKSIAKVGWANDGSVGPYLKIVQPWQFGVYRADMPDIESQEVTCETNFITKHDLWRRIAHMPDAKELFKKATTYAAKTTSLDAAEPYFHSVLISGTPPVVQTDPPFMAQPGGLIQVTADPAGAMVAPEVAVSMIPLHELWVLDDVRQDYTMIQIAEPDILIAPRYQRKNPFVPKMTPYVDICCNPMSGNFWGRSEIADLMMLQRLLRDRLEDLKKLFSLQYDRLYAFMGFGGMNDEKMDQFKQSGYIANAEPTGGEVKDLTPPIPQGAFDEIKTIIGFMDEVSGFPPILSGQGEPGVRAGVHANTLVRTGSPRLRNRAIMAERDCAAVADKVFHAMCAKDPEAKWIDGGAGQGEAEFLLAQLPDDAMVCVDSHSSSPIFEEDHAALIAEGAKVGALDAEAFLELMQVPNRDLYIQRLKDRQAKEAAKLEELKKTDPDGYLQLIEGGAKKKK